METLERETIERPRGRRGRPPAIVSPHLLSVERVKDGTVVTLLVRGQLDLNSVLTFRDAVFSAMGEQPEQLTIDLSELRNLDNSGVSALVTVARVANLVRTDLRLVPTPRFRSLLIETGLQRLFTLVDDAPIALAA